VSTKRGELHFVLHGLTETHDAKQLYIVRDTIRQTLWVGGSYVYRASIAPNSKHVAFVSTQVNNDGKQNYDLLVLDLKGKLVAKADSGIRYSWSPDGNEIVFIKGYNIEMGEGFRPTQTGILNVETKDIQILDFRTYDVHWSSFDSQIYFIDYETGKVKSLDPAKGILRLTSYKGIYLSPDGAFYFKPNYEGGNFGLYTKDNVDITESFLRATGGVYPEAKWLDESKLLVRDENLKLDNVHRNLVFNVRMNKAIVFEGSIIGTSSNSKYVGIFHNGSVRVSNIMQLQKE